MLLQKSPKLALQKTDGSVSVFALHGSIIYCTRIGPMTDYDYLFLQISSSLWLALVQGMFGVHLSGNGGEVERRERVRKEERWAPAFGY